MEVDSETSKLTNKERLGKVEARLAQIEEALPASRTTRRLASICLGSFVLGDAGLLQQRRATTHWRSQTSFSAAFLKTRVEIDRIFVDDGPVWTSAGMSAGMDLALNLLENDHGRELAKRTAQGLVHTSPASRRAIAAFGTVGARRQVRSSTDCALAYAKRNLCSALSTEELAGVACLSPRQFTRVFREETGVSPGRAGRGSAN